MKEEEKKKKTTKKDDKKKVAKKETVKKETKKATTKKETPKKETKAKTTKKTSTKKEEFISDPKKVAKIAEEKREAKRKATAKKTTKKEEKEKKETKKKVATKRVTKKVVEEEKVVSRFMPSTDDISNYEAHKDEIDEKNLGKNVYDSTFDHFYGEPYIGAMLEFDPSWEESENPVIRDNYIMAKDDALRIKNSGADVSVDVYNGRLPQQVIIDRNELIAEVAEVLHNTWVEEEIRNFYNGAKVAKNNFAQGIENLILAACYKQGKKRYEVSYDKDELVRRQVEIVESLDDYDAFRTLVGNSPEYVVNVKKYAKRNIVDSEKQSDYKYSTGEENILRPFNELSELSKKENVAAAIDAYNAYKELIEAGITLEEMKKNSEVRNLVLKSMNISQMKGDLEYRVRFSELDEREKEKDLFAFDVLINVVENNRSYTLYPLVDKEVPDYDKIENNIIEGIQEVVAITPAKAMPLVNPSAYEAEQAIKALENASETVNEGNSKVLGYAGIWTVALATAVLTAGVFIFGAFYFG